MDKLFIGTKKYLLIFTFFALLFATANISELFIQGYNDSVKRQEIDKKYEANGGKKFSFIICDFGAPKQYLQSKLLSFVVFLLSFLLLLKFGFWKTIFSLFLQLLSLLHFIFWFLDSYISYILASREFSMTKLADEYPLGHFSLPFRYLIYSNYLDFIALSFLIILIFWQVSTLYAFATEKFQAKISLR